MERTEYIPKIKVDPATGNPLREAPAEHPRETMTIKIPEPDPAQAREAEATDLSSQYAILKKIGDGGMGVVYLARDRKLGRYVAIKRLNKTGMTQATLKERFQREAKAIAILNHIHIVHVYALSEDQDGPYIVMEYIAGPKENAQNVTPPPPYTLADRVHKEGPFSLGDAVDTTIKLCSAVEYAHSCGVIHRDLKPSNVLLDESREPKLVDFGLARHSGLDADHLTVPGEKMLSLGYGAPEQETDASSVDVRADVYGLGALLYFSITGQNPRYFRENDLPETLRIPLVKALKTDRNKRWAGVGELKAALMLVKAPSTIDLPTSKTTWRCKWCDTINPVATPHCSGCGWDGRIFCAECEAETRFGIQFCGVCGADGKEYEQAHRILDRLLACREEKSFDKILEQGGAISGFIPVGANGQKLVSRIHDLEAEARKLSARRDQLRDLVKREMAGESYADAAHHIQEYHEISRDRAFAEQEQSLPELVLRRDLKRARKAIVERNWNYLKHEYLPMLVAQAPDNHEAQHLLELYRNRQRGRTVRDAAVIVALAALLYILSAAPLSRLLGAPSPRDYHRRIFQPVAALHEHSLLRRPLKWYAALWGASALFEEPPPPIPAAPEPPAPPAPAPTTPEEQDQLAELRKTYEESLAGIESNAVQRLQEWPDKFTSELTALQDELQRAGDFEGWSAVKDELLQFENSGVIPSHHDYELPNKLLKLRSEFQTMLIEYRLDKAQRVRQLADAHMEQLAERQKRLTMASQMDEAALVNAEIKRVKSSTELANAQAVLDAQKAREAVEKILDGNASPDSSATNTTP